MPDALDLEELYDDHAQALYALVLELTRGDADTKDILQEIFTKLARQPGILKSVRNVRAYLMRRRGTRDKYVQELALEMPEVFEPGCDADEQAFRQALNGALVELPDEQ